LPYKYFTVRFRNIEELAEVRRPIEVYKRFIDSIADLVSTTNFNKYSNSQQPYDPRIEIRLNMANANDENIAVATLGTISATMQSSHTIQGCDTQLRDWREPDFVTKAHETASACALTFKQRLDVEPATYTDLMSNKDDFMCKFMISLLRQAGFRPNVIWGFLRTEIPPAIINLASSCSPILVTSMENQRALASFVERFVHALFNCTVSQETVQFLPILTTSSIWQGLSDGWQAPA
jgi:hypothetical protein